MGINGSAMSAIALLVSCLISIKVNAGIFDDPVNLKVLPADISAEKLRSIMIGFTEATGLRCSGCHSGQEGAPLNEYDFASDEKERKKKARMMIRMVETINADYLSGIDAGVDVTCLTCHRGISSPQLTRDVLVEVARMSGVAAMRGKYRALRSEYYGTHSHDFSEPMLLDVASRVLDGDAKLALGVIELNLEYFPESFKGNFMMGQLLHAIGDVGAAREHYRRALDIRPDTQVVEALKGLDRLP